MSICNACGTENSDTATFCKNCGVTLESMICPQCQKVNSKTANFCENCGMNLVESGNGNKGGASTPPNNQSPRDSSKIWGLLIVGGLVFIIILLLAKPINQNNEANPLDKTPTLINENTNTPFVQPENVEKSSLLYKFLIDTIKDEKYDPNTHVLLDFIDGIYILADDSKIQIITTKMPDTPEVAYDLASETIFLASAFSSLEKWNSETIELVYPDPQNWEFKFFVNNPSDILQIAQNTAVISDVLDFSLSPQVEAMMTENPMSDPSIIATGNSIPIATSTKSISTLKPIKPTNTRVPPTKTQAVIQIDECKNFSSGYVTCRIQNAICSYKPSVKGSPTFCNDAVYPGNTFTYLVWGNDVSYLNNHCIVVQGNIKIYRGKPEIEANSNSGFVDYCD